MGRPTKYTDAVGQRIVEEIRRGLPVKFAAALAGVGEQTLRDWLARGEAADPPDADEPLVSFALLYREAEAEYVAEELRAIDGEHGEGKGDWKRTAWKLSKRFPREFGERKAIDVTTDGESLNLGANAAVVMYLPETVDDDADSGPGG